MPMLVSPSPLPSLLAYRARIGFQYCQFWPMGRELDFSTVNSGPVSEEGRKERGGDLIFPSLLPSLLAYRARIGFQYCQFWPCC